MKQGAIFDMDGLMFDTERIFRESWLVLAAEKYHEEPSIPFTAAVAGTAGDKMREVVKRFYPDIDADAYIADCYARVEEISSRDLPVKKGLGEILSLLKEKGFRMAVASASSRAVVERNLKKAGVDHYFDLVLSTLGEGIPSKPAPDVFIKAAEGLGLAPGECYVFEDGINGVLAGLRAGCTTVMVPDTMEPTGEIIEGGAHICRDLEEAAEAIARGEI